MEHPRISNSGTGVDRLEMGFYGKYIHMEKSLIIIDERKIYYTSKEIDTYMSLKHYVMFTQISEKKGIK